MRTGYAAERAFVEKHAGSLMALDDLKTIRERIEARLHWEYGKTDRHAARRGRAGAAARLQRHRAQVRRTARRRGPRGESLLQPPARPDADADRGRRLLDQRRPGRGPHPQGGERHAGAGRDRRLRPRHAGRVDRRRRHLGRGDGGAGPGPDALVGPGGGRRAAGHRPLLRLDAQHPGAVPAAGAGRGLRLRAGQPAAVRDHRAQLEHGVPRVDHHRQRDQLRHHPARPLPRVAAPGQDRRGGAGGGAVGDALGDACRRRWRRAWPTHRWWRCSFAASGSSG